MALTRTRNRVELYLMLGAFTATAHHVVQSQQQTMQEQDSASNGTTTAESTINVSQTALYENHPLASLFGKYSNEPLWDEFEAAIKTMRGEDTADNAKE